MSYIIGVLCAVIIAGCATGAVLLKKWRAPMMVMAILAIAALVIIPPSLVTVSTGQVGVVKMFGESKYTIGPGLHMQFWLTNTVEAYDIRTRAVDLNFQAYSRDAQTITGKLSVQYQIDPAEIMTVNRTYGSVEALEQKLIAVILERAKSVFSDKGAMTIVENRSMLSGEIVGRLTPVMPQYHVAITAVALEDIEFNEAFETAVEQKMIAEQEKLRSEYDKERAIIKSEELVEVAQREAQSAILKAEGEGEALRIMQSAWDSLSAEVKEAMLRQMFYDKWNGELPGVMAGDSLDLILDGNVVGR